MSPTAITLLFDIRTIYALRHTLPSEFAISGVCLYFFPHGNRVWLMFDVTATAVLYLGLLLRFGFLKAVDFEILGRGLLEHKLVLAVIGAASSMAKKFGRG